MRLRGRTDANQSKIVKELRQWGCSVLVLSNQGNGCPDLLVARGGTTALVEVKDPSQPPSGRKLTPDEKCFHESWQGDIYVIHGWEELIGKF